jgi:hypothetical protein
MTQPLLENDKMRWFYTKGGKGGGDDSRFTEKKTAISRFTCLRNWIYNNDNKIITRLFILLLAYR